MGGGGGSKTSTTTSGMAKEFIPYYEKALGLATNRLTSTLDPQGNLIEDKEVVAGLSPQQKAGLGAQSRLAQDALGGTGMYNTDAQIQRAMQNAIGAQEYGRQGALGSARGDRAQASAMADMGYQLAKDRQQVAEGGAQSLQDVGSVYQEQKQREMDAPYTELQRYSNVAFGNAPQTSTTNQTGGGK